MFSPQALCCVKQVHPAGEPCDKPTDMYGGPMLKFFAQKRFEVMFIGTQDKEAAHIRAGKKN